MNSLEALERIKRFSFVKDCEKDEVSTIGEFLPNTIKSIEKDLKAFEIIKEKRVDVNDLLLFVSRKAYNDFVIACDDNKKRVLTKQEYDLLKEVLEL